MTMNVNNIKSMHIYIYKIVALEILKGYLHCTAKKAWCNLLNYYGLKKKFNCSLLHTHNVYNKNKRNRGFPYVAYNAGAFMG